jgi:hypothetical protein
MPKRKKGGYRRRFRAWRARRKPTQVSIPILLTATAPLLRACSGYGKTMIESGDIIGGLQHIAMDTVTEYTGYSTWDNKFDTKFLMQTYVPLGIAVGVHALLGKRINPQLKRIPFLGKYIGV